MAIRSQPTQQAAAAREEQIKKGWQEFFFAWAGGVNKAVRIISHPDAFVPDRV